MGLFKKLDENNKIIYGIDFYAHGRRYRKLVGSKALAEAALSKVKVEVAENKFLDKKKMLKIKFEDFAAMYLENHCKVNHSDVNRFASVQIKCLKEFFRGKYLHEIDVMDVEQFKRKRLCDVVPSKGKQTKESKTVKPSTVNRSLAVLKNMFNKAIAWGQLEGKNPAIGVKMLNEGHGRLRYLEREEISKLLENCEGILKPIVVSAIHTGMRRGEILNLKWSDFDFQRSIIHLYKTKNKEKREVYMNAQVKDALIGVRKHKDSPYVFCRKDGSRVKDIRKSWTKALEKSNIKGLVFHSLRHTFCSQLVMAGVDLHTVRELAGHKSAEMTRRYSHLSPSHKQNAVNVLSQRLDVNRSFDKKEEIQTADDFVASLS